MKNITGKTELLKALSVGESALWVCEKDRLPSREMALFKALSLKLKIKLSQKLAVVATPGETAFSVVMVKRLE